MSGKNNTEKALMGLTLLMQQAQDQTITTRLPETDLSAFTYTKTLTREKKKYILGNFVVVDPDFLTTLKPDELKMAVQIIAAVKKNNALWYYDYRTIGGRSERTFLSLRKKYLLLETGFNDIHIVNPFMIRKGKIDSVIATTYHIIFSKKAITTSMIKDESPPDATAVSGYFTSQL